MMESFEFRERDILPVSFYEQEVHGLARDLLGRVLVRELGDAVLAGRIVEVEVYGGREDLASHGRSGRPSKRSWPMFERAGTSYVYKIYGMYDCLNIAAGAEGEPWAVLIRAVEPLLGVGEMAVRRGLGSEAPAARVGSRSVIGEMLAYLAAGSFLMVGSLSFGRYPSSQIV